MIVRLSQSKSYLKILDISYLIKDTNILIFANVVEKVIQSTHIFNKIVLVLKLRIMKNFPSLI